MMLLTAKNINFSHRKYQILKGIDLKVKSGELLMIIGPNGAGKSTLLNILANELQPKDLSVYFKKKGFGDWDIEELAQHKAKFSQEFNKEIGLTVKEIVLMGRYPYFESTPQDIDLEIIEKSMKATEVDHLKNRTYNLLSGGEKQRVHLARVLAQLDNDKSHKIAFFDEPLNNLDIRHQYHILGHIKTFVNQGNAAVLVLHDLNLAAEFADRLLLLKKGRVAAIGKTNEIFKHEIISDAYDFPCTICENPVNNCPMIVFRKHAYKKTCSL